MAEQLAIAQTSSAFDIVSHTMITHYAKPETLFNTLLFRPPRSEQ